MLKGLSMKKRVNQLLYVGFKVTLPAVNSSRGARKRVVNPATKKLIQIAKKSLKVPKFASR